MLDTSSDVKIAVFLNLTLLLAFSGFVDGELDNFIKVSHDDGIESRVFSVHHLIIDGPESVEVKGLFVPFGSGDHFVFRLVSDDVINDVELGGGKDFVEGVLKVVFLEAGEESALVVLAVDVSLDESVDGVSVGLDTGDDDRAVLIRESLGFSDRLGTSLNSEIINSLGVFDGQGNVSNTVTVLSQVLGHGFILVFIRTIGGGEGKDDIAVLHNVGSDVSFAGFETLVGKVFKTESGSIETGSLSGVSNPEKNMVETKESTDFRSSFSGVH